MEISGFGNMTLDDIIRTAYADKVLREMLSAPTSSWDAFRARLELLGNRLPEHANVVSIVQIGKPPAPEEDMPAEDLRQRWRRLLEGVIGRDGAVFTLGGNRFGTYQTVRNLWLVFLASGFWHGASWTFVLWGIWHGTLISIEKCVGPDRMKRIPRLLGIAVTFLLVALGWVLFRSENLPQASRFYLLLFGFLPEGAGLPSFPEILADRMLWLVATLAIPGAFAPAFRWDRLLPTDPADPDAMPMYSNLIRFGLSLVILVITASELCSSDFNPFIYFRF